jgi:hypothetical protein
MRLSERSLPRSARQPAGCLLGSRHRVDDDDVALRLDLAEQSGRARAQERTRAWRNRKSLASSRSFQPVLCPIPNELIHRCFHTLHGKPGPVAPRPKTGAAGEHQGTHPFLTEGWFFARNDEPFRLNRSKRYYFRLGSLIRRQTVQHRLHYRLIPHRGIHH